MSSRAEPRRHRAFIALGTNLGDRLLNLSEARRQLASLGSLRRGLVIETPALLPPEDPTPQPAYLNSVDELSTTLSPRELFTNLKRIERHMGRRLTTRWAPRIIDLDLILFDDLVHTDDTLIIPHPRMHERRFVLEPLAHLAPNLRHPLNGQSVQALLQDVLRRAS